MNHIFIKNSSKDINFGDYDLKVKICTDGGRVYQDRNYLSRVYCNEKKNLITVLVVEQESSFDLYERTIKE